ncbi:stimulated by retinoic acid gene 6 protein-like [Diadema setosum]|uniref:stimulated by retinoic acid gene 6 protein-like n=1 Tax=Diadema setosum TaxID=31175 RepID=UPI003B3A3151
MLDEYSMSTKTETGPLWERDSVEEDSCEGRVQMWWILLNLFPAMVLVILATFCRFQTGPCKWQRRPRLAYPVNLLDGYSNRLAYLLVFLIMSNVVINMVIFGAGGKEIFAGLSPPMQFILSALVKYITVIMLGLLFYPLLLCITYNNVFTDVCGFLYTCDWSVMHIHHYLACTDSSLPGPLRAMKYVPELVSCLILAIFFAHRSVARCRASCAGKAKMNFILLQDDHGFRRTHYYRRVKHLLTPPNCILQRKPQQRFLRRLKTWIYPDFPGFKYSTRMVCTVGVSVAIIFQFPSFCQCLLPETTRLMWKGDRSCFPAKDLSAHSVVIYCLRFSGYSMAYMHWGFLVLLVTLWMLTGTMIALIRYQAIALFLLQKYWAYFFGIITFIFIQHLLARCVLLKRNANGSLVIDNRRFFHIAMHFFFFLNLLVGLFGCIKRICKCALISVLLLGRVDRCLAPPGFERFDQGYSAYRAFLELEVSLSHPVVVTFCHLLTQSQTKTEYDEDVERGQTESDVGNDMRMGLQDLETTFDRTTHTKARRVRNRWFVAYTLIRNKALQSQRHHHLDKEGGEGHFPES